MESASSLAENVDYIKESLFQSADLKKRSVHFDGREGMLLYIESLTDDKRLWKEVLQPITRHREGELEEILPAVDIKPERDLTKGVDALVDGNSLLFLEESREFFILGTGAAYKRDIKEPENESVVRGAHDGFVEQLTINLYSIRKRINSPRLKVRFFEIGRIAKTKVAMVYMEDLANPDLIKAVEERVNTITADTLTSAGFLQEFTEDAPLSPFPQHLNTERPDRTVAHVMEGRVALLLEGDPTALIAPVTLFAFYQTPDDYHSRWIVGSFVRAIRLMSFLIAFQLPAFYIATIAFHAAILPIDLIFSIKGSLEQVPFPPLIEALLMELIFELLREAGIRLPSRVGQTIGIVGGLVIGDAIVKAGLVSYTMIIVVAMTAIASFLVPSNEMSASIRILRFPMMIAAATFGYIGISFVLMIIFIHLIKIHSFGTPYLAPVAPLRIRDMKDTFLRFPIWILRNRPHDPHPKRMEQESISREWNRRDP
nr:spore germination protein [Paludifilum halophilum]